MTGLAEFARSSQARLSGMTIMVAAAVATVGHVSAQPAVETHAAGTLTITVTGARNTKGKIAFSLYRDANGFPDTPANALRHETADIDTATSSARVAWSDVAPGTYAVSVLHDENVNGKMDKNFIGIPREGYGASNNPPKKKRAPTFDEARFSFTGPEQALVIKLIY